MISIVSNCIMEEFFSTLALEMLQKGFDYVKDRV